MFIVVVMVLSLVLWGFMGRSSSDENLEDPAGTIYDTVRINKGDFRLHTQKAMATWWWKKYSDPMQMFMMRYRRPEPPNEGELAKQAWENIVLLHDAKMKGIGAGEQEALMFLRDVMDRATGGRAPHNDETLQQVAEGAFHTSARVLQLWAADQVIIDKLLALVDEAEFADYSKVYDDLAKDNRLARVAYAGFDPESFRRQLKSVRPDEVASYYEKNKAKYKQPAKVQVAFLMADVEAIKKTLPDPAEDEVKKYYEDHKAEFLKPSEKKDDHDDHEGHDHKAPQEPGKDPYKPFDEVKGDIPDKIKNRKAEEKAREFMARRVNPELGKMVDKDTGKFPPDVFDLLKAKFKGEPIELVHDITGLFDAKQVDDVEKAVGTGSALLTWGFEAARAVGDISKLQHTSKGSLLFRIQMKKDAEDAGITEQVRERITKTLQQEQLQKKAQTAANNVVQDILGSGFAAARRKHPMEWRSTHVFRVNRGDTGVSDSALSNAIAQQVRNNQLSPQIRAATLASNMVRSAEKKDWSYALYLEDILDGAPENPETDFRQAREKLDGQARHEWRQKYTTDMVASANVKDLVTKQEAAPPQPAAPGRTIQIPRPK
jgi:hypothetical protein